MARADDRATLPDSDLSFRVMSFVFRISDLFTPRERVLEEVGIQPGWWVLDYGCGRGRYVPAISTAVGDSGRVYALDFHPLAITSVERIAARRHLVNVTPVLTRCATWLSDRSIDAVLLYNTYHTLEAPRAVMAEIERVLKPRGILSFSDHHMNEDEVVAEINRYRAFELRARARKTYTFVKRALDADDDLR